MYNFRERTVFAVEYSEIEDIIQKVYNQPKYSFVDDVKASNDTDYMNTDIGLHALGMYEQADIEKFRKHGKYNGIIHTLLEDMAQHAIIPMGTYVISAVCW